MASSVLQSFWLPILLSAVFVFIASASIHMVLKAWHKSDYRKLPEEDKVMEALRPFRLPPGDYMVPNCSGSAEMKSPAFREKMRQGPVMILTVMPNGAMNIGKSLVLWFLYTLVVSFFAAYVPFHSLPAGAPLLQVLRLVGVTSFVGYTIALWQMSIWYCRSWTTTIKATIDGIVYAAITAVTFAWLWRGR